MRKLGRAYILRLEVDDLGEALAVLELLAGGVHKDGIVLVNALGVKRRREEYGQAGSHEAVHLDVRVDKGGGGGNNAGDKGI